MIAVGVYKKRCRIPSVGLFKKILLDCIDSLESVFGKKRLLDGVNKENGA